MSNSYISTNIQNGSTFETILDKLLAYKPEALSFVELDCNEISTRFTVPSNSLYYLPCGNYKTVNLPNSPFSSSFVNILVFSKDSNKYILAILGHERFSVELTSAESPVSWNNVSYNDVENPSFIHIGNTAPSDSSLIWIDTSTLISGDSVYIKYFNDTIWKDYIFEDMMDVDIYDSQKIQIDPFQYITNKVANLLAKYAEFIRHKNNEFTLFHITSEEKYFYNNYLLTLAEIAELFKSNGEVYYIMLEYIAYKSLEVTGYDTNNQKFLDNLDTFGKHSLVLLETTISTTPRLWFAVAYGNDRFVAIAFHSNICAYSRNGITWTESNISNTTRNWISVCYGDDRFVAIANNSNIAAYSLDGITWTEVKVGLNNRDWTSICYGNNKYVAIASGNIFAYSEDGITWTEIIIPKEDFWHSICYGYKFIAISDASNNFAYSLDGITWSIGTISTNEDRIWKSICYGDNEYIAISYDSNIFARSSNGIQWQEGIVTDTERKWNILCYGMDRFIAISYESKYFAYLLTGNPRNPWTSVSTLPYEFIYGSAVVYNNEIHVFGGHGFNIGHYKWNGTTWSSVSIPYGFDPDFAVVYNNEIHVFGGHGFNIGHYKWNGILWTELSRLPYGAYRGAAVVYNNEIHILGGDHGGGTGPCTNHYKYNGTTWTSVSTLPYKFYQGSAVVYSNEIHILGSAVDTAHYKYNGTTWTKVSTLPYYFWRGSAVVYNNEIHILGSAVDTSSHKHYKYDGSDWTSVSTLPYVFYNGDAVVYNNEIHIIGSAYDTGSHNHFKYDGTSWIQGTLTSDAKSWYSACYGANRFIIVAQNSNTLTNLNGDITDHISSEKVEFWDSKSDSTHTHNLANNVTINSTKVSNQLHDSHVANANEKIVRISSIEILGEEISEEDLKTKYRNGNTLYTQDSNDNTTWWKILNNSKFGNPSTYRDGIRYLSSVINVPTFNMILNKPSSLSGYGITDTCVSKEAIDMCMTDLTHEIVPDGYDKNSLLKGTSEFYPIYLGIQKSKRPTGGGSQSNPMSTLHADLDIIIVCDKSENLSTTVNRFTCEKGMHTYLNRNSEAIQGLIQPGISKHSSAVPASRYFTTLYNKDSENPKWDTQGLGRMIKIDTSKNNTIINEIYTINNRTYHVKVVWNTIRGIVFSIQLGESVACHKEIRDTLLENTTPVSVRVNQVLDILSNI